MTGFTRFLTADWRYLVMLNYSADPAILRPLVPAGTELDAREGETLLSLVGFRFLGLRVLGLPIPLHRDFDEINLRFYVRRAAKEGWRRGVVFVKELVPRAAITWMARRLFNENYETAPVSHVVDLPDGASRPIGRVSYAWKLHGEHALGVHVEGESEPIGAGSHEEFVSERHWGYTRQRDGDTLEYPFFLLSTAPVLRGVFDWSYRTFAKNRYHFSRACRLPGRSGSG